MRVSFAPIAIAALAASILSGCSLLGGPDIEAMQATVGECISDPAVSEEGEQEVGALPVVECSEPHYGEVYYTEDLTAEEFPGTVSMQADDICLENYEAYVGAPYEESQYYISSIYPSYDTWEAGDRQIACLVTGNTGEELTGSLKGAEA